MGSVGINFGSPTSGAGFDVTTTVASIVANLQQVENPWNTQLTSLKADDSALTSIGTDLGSLSTSLQALTDFQGVMTQKEGSSSDTDVVTLSSAGPTAVAGSHTIVVKDLAQTSSEYTDTVGASDVLSGGLTIQVGSGTPTTIPVVSGVSDTVATYAAAINLAGIGVSASVISDTTGSRLSLVSDISGLAGQLTVSSGGTVPAAGAATTPADAVAPTATDPATSTFTLPAASDLLSGSFSYAVGSDSPATVNLGTTPLSLSGAAAALNADSGFSGSGLVASVEGASLIVTGATDPTGAAIIDTSASSLTTTTPAITVPTFTDTSTSTPTAIGIHTGLTAQNADITVDGLEVKSASNTISTAIPGVTFQLLSAAPDTQVQVQIANDNTDIETAFQAFVTNFNTVLKDLTTQEGNDSSGNSEPLYGNPIISQIQSSLSIALTAGAASGSISSLDQLGITVQSDGTLSLDSSTLDATLNSNYSDVVGFLQNTGSFGLNLSAALDNLGNTSPTGALTLALGSDTSQETTFNDDITAQNTLIATDKASITTQLNAANEALQSIPDQLNEVNELYSAMTGYDNNSNG